VSPSLKGRGSSLSMPMIEIDTNAKNILIDWKKHFGSDIGAAVDYSEAIRCANGRVFPIPSEGIEK